MGELLAFGSALSFSLSSLLIKFGQRKRPHDNGLFMTTVTNLALYAVLTLGSWALGQLPPLTWAGFLLFIAAGVTNTMVGRWAWFQSMRIIGPSRSTSLKVTNPAFAAVLAFFFLAQPLAANVLVGLVFVLGGVLFLNYEVSRQRYSSITEGPLSAQNEVPKGMALGMFSSLSYGCGAVLRAAGLGYVPSPYVGALIGSVVAAGGVVVSDVVRGNLRQRWEDNLRDVPLPFVIAGVLAGVGQLTQFASLQFTTVARSTVIASAEPMITALLSVLFFRQLDTVTPRSGIAVAIIVVGIGIVAFKP